MNQLLLIFLFATLSPIFSQSTGNEPRMVAPNTGNQFSQNIVNEEKRLDEAIRSVYDSMQVHARLISMKIKDLPRNTVIYKGKIKGNDCIEDAVQEDLQNNCLKLEIFDFIGAGSPKPSGAKSKSLVLFFDSDAGDPNPRLSPPRKLNKIKLSIYSNDLVSLDKSFVEVIDEDPLAAGDHNEKITIRAQYDDLPQDSDKERPSEFSFGRFKLSLVDNTKSNPLRNEFKRESMFKQLRFFHENYTKIYDFNDLKLIKRINQNKQKSVNSLKY